MIAATLAAFLTVAAGGQVYEVERWLSPTAADLEWCASQAADLQRQGAQAVCELVPMAD
ncbi:hypothetical protein D3C85_664690 [compost metagenome]